jgi:hypothetical protein
MASTLEDVGKQENPRLYFVTRANECARHEVADIAQPWIQQRKLNQPELEWNPGVSFQTILFKDCDFVFVVIPALTRSAIYHSSATRLVPTGAAC